MDTMSGSGAALSGAALSGAASDAALDAKCRRIAAWSLALERVTGALPERGEEILELAESLDAYFGWEPFGLPDEGPDDIAQAALACLRVVTPDDLQRAIEKLPVFPLAAQRALSVILRDDWSVADLESVAASDQALAAQLIRAANSGTRPTWRPIATIPQSILHIGADRASRIIYAASIQPMYATPRLRDLWHHSLASAEVAESLGRISRSIDPKKAFLAGLVHDIGVLAMSGLPQLFHDLMSRVTSLGCESIQAERALCGFSHAQAGALALRTWAFPEEISLAVEFHHAPERSGDSLPSILYLTEQWTDASEDAPSVARFHFALKRLGISERQFEQLAPPEDLRSLQIA